MWWFESVWPIESGTVRRCGFVGGSMPLVWMDFEALPSVEESLVSYLPSYKDLELLAPLAPCLLGYCHALTVMIMD